MKIRLLFFIFCFLVFAKIEAQNTAEEAARTELTRKGLNEDEVKKRLAEKGIDLYSLNPADAASMLKAEKALEEVLRDLDAEKVRSKPAISNSTDTLKEDQKKILAKKTEEVSEAVEEGASLEEAVSETLTEEQKVDLPIAKIFGQEIFRSQSIKLYRKSKDVKAPNSYVLGVGDIIGISIWGNSEESQIFEINEDGYIKPPGISRIYLKGIKYGEAKKLLLNKLSNYYSFQPNQFEVSLNFSRTINVNVVGEVFNFGSFNIPAINTAFNALVAAGGPSDIGSVRKIQLMRSGKQPRTIDIYKYLLDPRIDQDFYLEENDVIFVPIAEKLVTINGAVKKPFIYELLPNEHLKALIEFAKGLNPNALTKNIQVFRYENDKEIVIDVDWTNKLKTNEDFILKPGDRVVINAIPSSYDNFVNISGAVEVPGKYSFTNGDKVSSLFQKLKILDDAYLDLSYIRRLNSDKKTISYLKVNIKEALANPNGSQDIALQKEDEIVLLSQSYFLDFSTFSVTGAVREGKSFGYDYQKTIKVSDALFLTGGVRKDAADFAYIKREDPKNPKQLQYIRINLSDVLKNENSKDNLTLEARDTLFVPSVSEYIDSLFVSVDGYVRKPGRFLFDESLTVSDILSLSGGLKYEAADNKIDIYRISIDDNKKTKLIAASFSVDQNLNIVGDNIKLMPYDDIVVRKASEFKLQQNIIIEGNIKYDGKYALISDNERLSSVINRAGGLSNIAAVEAITIKRSDKHIIVADFEKALRKPGSVDDIILKAGDRIIIPSIENLVFITGLTTANSLFEEKVAVPFEKGKSAKYYVNKYGAGIAPTGSLSKIVVTQRNGKVDDVGHFLFFKIYPKVNRGASINVGPKLSRKERRQSGEPVDWNRILTNSVAQATSILTLILLTERIN